MLHHLAHVVCRGMYFVDVFLMPQVTNSKGVLWTFTPETYCLLMSHPYVYLEVFTTSFVLRVVYTLIWAALLILDVLYLLVAHIEFLVVNSRGVVFRADYNIVDQSVCSIFYSVLGIYYSVVLLHAHILDAVDIHFFCRYNVQFRVSSDRLKYTFHRKACRSDFGIPNTRSVFLLTPPVCQRFRNGFSASPQRYRICPSRSPSVLNNCPKPAFAQSLNDLISPLLLAIFRLFPMFR